MWPLRSRCSRNELDPRSGKSEETVRAAWWYPRRWDNESPSYRRIAREVNENGLRESGSL